MGEHTGGRPAERGQRFTDRGERFGRRRFLGKAGITALAVGTGLVVAGCRFDDGPYQGNDTGESSTSGQNATPSPSQSPTSGGSQSGASS